MTPASVEVSSASPGETPIRRAAQHPESLVTHPAEGVDTLYDLLEYCARAHGTKNALGWRDIIDIHEEKKTVKKMVGGKEVSEDKVWKYFELSDYKYYSYIEVRDRVEHVAKGLVSLGVNKGEVFNVYASTSVNWQIVAHACGSIATPIATAYDTLGESGLQHSLSEPGCVGVFTNAELLGTLGRVLANTPTVKLIVYDGTASNSHLEQIKSARNDITLIALDDLLEKGKGIKDLDLGDRRPAREDTSCIMYTSGSTGAPKGVVLTHGNIIASVGATTTILRPLLKHDDTFLAYLPLAHILEYVAELTMYTLGVTAGYGRVKTLTDASVRKCLGDMRAFAPSIMIGVPAVWETIRKGIMSKVDKMGTLKKGAFNSAIAVKRANVPVLTIAADMILGAVKSQTGGRLRLTLSGGAALSKETQEFLTLALVTVLQGYGLTESCGMCTVLLPDYMSYGPVGAPVPSIEIKLQDVESANYRATNNPPQGEVLIRGNSVTKGYFKRPDLNEDPEIFTKDGWFRTGDVGQWNQDGTLSIIDRIKNLVKLSGGEYIALERLESIYKSCNLVSNICVHASTDASKPMAIIFPHEHNIRHVLSSNAPAGMKCGTDAEFATLCEDPAIAELILKETNAAGKKAGFKPMETLESVVLTHEEWTAENGLLTAAQKIQRKKVAEKYKDQIKTVYPY